MIKKRINSNFLKGKITEKRLNYQKAADYIGVTQSTFNKKINQIKTSFLLTEFLDLLELLDIDNLNDAIIIEENES